MCVWGEVGLQTIKQTKAACRNNSHLLFAFSSIAKQWFRKF
jgi:hypothetical protein